MNKQPRSRIVRNNVSNISFVKQSAFAAFAEYIYQFVVMNRCKHSKYMYIYIYIYI